MILNAHDDDFWKTYSDAEIKIYVNGKKIELCIYADTTKGFAEYLMTDSSGKHLIEDDDIKTAKAYGDVMIQIEKKVSER